MQRLHLGIALCLIAGCSKSSDTAANSPKTQAPAEGWLVYEDNLFKAEYPAGSEIWGASNGQQNPDSPNLGIVPPPHANKSGIGAFVLQTDKVTQNMLLRDAIQTEIARYKAAKGILVAAPTDIPVKNGRCIAAVMVAPADNCPKNTGSCFSPMYLTQCDGPNGKRFTASTMLSVGSFRDNLSPQARSEAAVYERILRSLEFKKS